MSIKEAVLFQVKWAVFLGIFATGIIFSGANTSLAENNSDKTLVISAIKDNITGMISADILVRAYEKIQVPMTIRWLPARRALIEANNGITDGDTARVPGTEKKFTNLIRVPSPVNEFKGVAFSLQDIEGIEDWSDLRPYRIGIQRGIRYTTAGTQGMDPTLANSPRELMVLLLRDRADIVVTSEINGTVSIKNHFKDAGIRIVGKPLHYTKVYHLLHRKHAYLVPKLAKALDEMAKSGEIAQIRENSIMKLINSRQE